MTKAELSPPLITSHQKALKQNLKSVAHFNVKAKSNVWPEFVGFSNSLYEYKTNSVLFLFFPVVAQTTLNGLKSFCSLTRYVSMRNAGYCLGATFRGDRNKNQELGKKRVVHSSRTEEKKWLSTFFVVGLTLKSTQNTERWVLLLLSCVLNS